MGGVGAAVDALRQAGASSIAGVLLLAGKVSRPASALGSFAPAPVDAVMSSNGHSHASLPESEPVTVGSASSNGNGTAPRAPKRRAASPRPKRVSHPEPGMPAKTETAE